jgi:signal transduction histidine kinase
MLSNYMPIRSRALSLFIELPLSIFFLAILVPYTIIHFFGRPYVGFDLLAPNGVVTAVYVNPKDRPAPKVGDQLLQAGALTWHKFIDNETVIIFEGYQTGDVIPLTLLRDGEEIHINWIAPGASRAELLARLFSAWWLPYAFWLAGAATLILVRPKDRRVWLLALFNFSTAFWFATGFVSLSRIWDSLIFYRGAVWLNLPLTLHFGWEFPKPLRRIPNGVLILPYGIGVGLAISAQFEPYLRSHTVIGLTLAAFGGFILMIAHIVTQPRERGQMIFLMSALILALTPALTLSFARLMNTNTIAFETLGEWALLLIPVAYFYVVYRRQLGDLELRANRAVTVLAFSALMLTTTFLAVFLVNNNRITNGISLSQGLIVVTIAALIGILFFSIFQRWFEHRILRIPLPPTHLVELYASRIATSLEIDRLSRLLKDEVFPSLQIREAALLSLPPTKGEGNNQLIQILTMGVNPDDLPTYRQVQALLARPAAMRSHPEDIPSNLLCPWAKLILPVRVSGVIIAICLLGRRDPDDLYPANEIPTLQALVHQTGLAIVNIRQAARLRALYQHNLERQEVNRNYLVEQLEAKVLEHLGVLAMQLDERSVSKTMQQYFQNSVQRTRELIGGIRPNTLNIGLGSALDELIEEISAQAANIKPAPVNVFFKIPPSSVRYPDDVELHLYRIVQQACQNVLKHAQAESITIEGSLEEEMVHLIIRDDGVGFLIGKYQDLSWFLVNKHYGLAGMYERAALIGATLKIHSTPYPGTKVEVTWHRNQTSTALSGAAKSVDEARKIVES